MSGKRYGWVAGATHTAQHTTDLHTVEKKFRRLYIRSEFDKYVHEVRLFG